MYLYKDALLSYIGMIDVITVNNEFEIIRNFSCCNLAYGIITVFV
jgi:hypothetical protein